MTYTEELLDIIVAYIKDTAGIEADGDGIEYQESDGVIARQLHIELCRKSGMTADEIIVEWNRRSPEDLW